MGPLAVSFLIVYVGLCGVGQCVGAEFTFGCRECLELQVDPPNVWYFPSCGTDAVDLDYDYFCESGSSGYPRVLSDFIINTTGCRPPSQLPMARSVDECSPNISWDLCRAEIAEACPWPVVERAYGDPMSPHACIANHSDSRSPRGEFGIFCDASGTPVPTTSEPASVAMNDPWLSTPADPSTASAHCTVSGNTFDGLQLIALTCPSHRLHRCRYPPLLPQDPACPPDPRSPAAAAAPVAPWVPTTPGSPVVPLPPSTSLYFNGCRFPRADGAPGYVDLCASSRRLIYAHAVAGAVVMPGVFLWTVITLLDPMGLCVWQRGKGTWLTPWWPHSVPTYTAMGSTAMWLMTMFAARDTLHHPAGGAAPAAFSPGAWAFADAAPATVPQRTEAEWTRYRWALLG
eukprot:TRINITY_DN32774_c0_g1_i1.p1 TRINITY_DN32774_c0_g1~~TRINITY_DN32774_c0_g1_i1.p1  ORF type:complete len:401 (+),score=23.25 TRINITY_DN32774_c0_g1_i1:94-1296(+)